MPIMRRPGGMPRPGMDQDGAEQAGPQMRKDNLVVDYPGPPEGTGTPYTPGKPLPPFDGPFQGDDGLEWRGAPERAGTEPRDNPDLRGTGGAGFAPPKPKQPTPMAGSVSSPGVMPFNPMPQPAGASLANPARRGLYGSLGGLQGGGLGVPLDPVSDQQSNPIDTLIQLLSQRVRGR